MPLAPCVYAQVSAELETLAAAMKTLRALQLLASWNLASFLGSALLSGSGYTRSLVGGLFSRPPGWLFYAPFGYRPPGALIKSAPGRKALI